MLSNETKESNSFLYCNSLTLMNSIVDDLLVKFDQMNCLEFANLPTTKEKKLEILNVLKSKFRFNNTLILLVIYQSFFFSLCVNFEQLNFLNNPSNFDKSQ